MRIAINICKFGNYTIDENYVKGFFLELATQEKNVDFILLATEGVVKKPYPENFIILETSIGKGQNLYSWYKYQRVISAAIKEHGVDIFITPIIFSKLFIKCEQLLLLPSAGPLVKPSGFKKVITDIFKTYIIPSIKKANGLITSSEAWKDYFTKTYAKGDQEIFCMQSSFNSPDHFDGLRGAIKTDSAYFLVIDEEINNDKIIFVLKAFSIFKKRLRSTMKMIFVTEDNLDIYEATIKAYKYKNDVMMIQKKGEGMVNELIQNSYAVILNSEFNGFVNKAQLATGLGSVLIMASSIYNKDAAGDIEGFYYETENIIELSGHMMEIYKNEKLRSDLLLRNQLRLDKIEKATMYKNATTFLMKWMMG